MKDNSIILPGPNEIQAWNDLSELPINGTTPRSVPLINLVATPTDDDYGYRAAQGTKVSATDSIMQILLLDFYIGIIEKHIAYIYPLRSTTRGLEDALKEKKAPQDKINPVAAKMLEDLMTNFKLVRTHCEDTNMQISALFHQKDFWMNGLYSDVFLDKLFFLIFRLISLGKLCPTRTALSDDLSTLHKQIKPQDPKLLPMELRMWMNTPNAIKQDLLKQLNDVEYPVTNHIFNVFVRRITDILNEERYIYPDMETACVISLLFIIDFYVIRQQAEANDKTIKKKVLKPLPQSIIPLIAKERVRHPALLLVFEFAVDFDQFIYVANDIVQGLGEKPRPRIDLFSTMNELSECFNNVSQVISRLTSNDTPSKELVGKIIDLLPKAFRILGSSIHTLVELIVDKHDHSPSITKEGETEEDKNKLPPSKFELAMRYGLNDDEREYIMRIIALCRSFREVITSDLPRLNAIISEHIQQEIQNFVKYDLEIALMKNSGKVKEQVNPDLEKLRVLMGYFKKDSDLIPKARGKDSPQSPVDDPHSPPHIALIQLLRSQIQMIINPESSAVSTKFFASSLDKSVSSSFTKFLRQSEFYIDLLQLEKTVNKVCDQSSLFFKEFFLDMYRNSSEVKKIAKGGAIHFPVTASVPYVLIDYTISHPEKLELIGSLYYPLSIYDDAASKALRYLDSRYLFEEIRAESEICVLTISKMIADFVFEKVRGFFTASFADHYNKNLLKSNQPDNNENSLRIITILQQNQLFLLGNYIDISSLYVSRLNEMFYKNVASNFQIIQTYGILGIVVFSKTLSILKETHNTFLNYGLKLTPFDDIVDAVIGNGTPDSFRSGILENVVHHMAKRLIPKFFLHSNPHRLVPPLSGDASIIGYLKSKKNIIHPSLRQTTSFITVEHFRELFKYTDDGGVVFLIHSIKSTLQGLFDEFINIYKDVRVKIRRITNIPIGTGCHKAYDMFEGAYRSFMTEKQIDQLFDIMKSIGNVIAIAEMCDYGFGLKRFSSQQILAYLFQNKIDNIESTDLGVFSMLDPKFKEYQKYFTGISPVPNKTEINPSFLQEIIAEIAKICRDKWELFDETTSNIYDFPSLNGFAAVWSVLEFIFCLKEVYRKEGSIEEEEDNKKVNRGSFAQFGEGVLICGAAILCVTRQQNLSKVLSIGDRISQMKRTDLAILEEDDMKKFLFVNKLVQNSIEFSVSSIYPTIESIFNGK